MPKVFHIVLDPTSTGSYHPGSLISGKVCLSLKESLKTRGLRLTFKAMETVTWTEGSGDYSVTYTASRQLLFCEETLFGYPKQHVLRSGEDYQSLPAGNSEFPFKIQIPFWNDLPPSFASIVGNINYSLVANIDRIRWFDHYSNMLDLPFEPFVFASSDEKRLIQRQKNLSLLGCIKRGSMEVSATFPEEVLRGSTLALEITVKNLSEKVDITHLTVKLKKQVTSRACQKTKSFKNDLARFIVPGSSIKRSDSSAHTFTAEFPIPEDLVVSFGSPINLNEYYIKVNIHTSGVHRRISAKGNITICNFAVGKNEADPLGSDNKDLGISVGPMANPDEFDADFLPEYKEKETQ